jgi:hypothetical protein
MRRGFAESKWQMATAPSSSASSKTVNTLVGRAGKFFRTMECNSSGIIADARDLAFQHSAGRRVATSSIP